VTAALHIRALWGVIKKENLQQLIIPAKPGVKRTHTFCPNQTRDCDGSRGQKKLAFFLAAGSGLKGLTRGKPRDVLNNWGEIGRYGLVKMQTDRKQIAKHTGRELAWCTHVE